MADLHLSVFHAVLEGHRGRSFEDCTLVLDLTLNVCASEPVSWLLWSSFMNTELKAGTKKHFQTWTWACYTHTIFANDLRFQFYARTPEGETQNNGFDHTFLSVRHSNVL